MPAKRTFADTNVWFYAFVRGDNPEDARKTEIANTCIRKICKMGN
jgi:predicted nucleic acid-binding protein